MPNVFEVIPFIQLQNDTYQLNSERKKKKKKNEMES